MLDLKLDDWQKQVLETEGNMCLCSGRQVGKSTVIAIKAGKSACTRRNRKIMVIASTERQAYLLFEKILSWIHENHKKLIKTGLFRPTKTKLQLTNGSIIHCLPTGDTGYGIRGFTIDELYADEAAFISEEVWAAVTPMLATTGGHINLLSTPFGTQNYFFRCFNDKMFKSFQISTEEVANKREERQKQSMLDFLKDEKTRMTRLQYQQEYLGLFVGGIMRLFPDELINKCCTLSPSPTPSRGDLFLGIDIARMGGDETVLISVQRIERKKVRMIDMEIPEGQRLTDTTRLILSKNSKFGYKKIYIDDGGMGIGVYDSLFEHEDTKRKIVGINNATRSIDKEKGQDSNRKKPLLKVDLYNNLVKLMEGGVIEMFDDARIRQSLRSMQYEYGDSEQLKIYGNYSHIAEALIRAAWCMKDKSLNIYVY